MHYFGLNICIVTTFILYIGIVTSLPADNVFPDSIRQEASYSTINRSKRNSNPLNLRPRAFISMNIAIMSYVCISPPEEHIKTNSCVINVKTLEQTHALIIDPRDHTKFRYPDKDGNIFFLNTQPVFLSCSRNNNAFKLLPGKSSETFTCYNEQIFKAGDTLYNFRDLICDNIPRHDIIDLGHVPDEFEIHTQDNEAINGDKVGYVVGDKKGTKGEVVKENLHKYAIGFYTDATDNFLKIIDVAYNDTIRETAYVTSWISGKHKGGQPKKVKSKFNQKFCCGDSQVDMDNIYKKESQDCSFAIQLLNHKGITDKNSYLQKGNLFNRGHLTYKASMLYRAAALGTHAYLNTLPQWLNINGGNWARIEDFAVKMAEEIEQDLLVITGGFGTLELTDTVNGNRMKKMYLHAERQGEIITREFPIPLYYYKIIINPEESGRRSSLTKGVVFVTVNNPYISPGPEYYVCDNPIFTSDRYNMPRQFKPEKPELGYSYMCEVPDFVNKNPNLKLASIVNLVTELL